MDGLRGYHASAPRKWRFDCLFWKKKSKKKKTFTDNYFSFRYYREITFKSQVYLVEVKVKNRCHVLNQEFSTYTCYTPFKFKVLSVPTITMHVHICWIFFAVLRCSEPPNVPLFNETACLLQFLFEDCPILSSRFHRKKGSYESFDSTNRSF